MAGKFEVYRVKSDANHANEMTLVGSLVTTEILRKVFLQAHYIFGVADGNSSRNLTIIDVKKPNAPVEVVVFDVGSVTRGVHAQGRLVYVACADGVKIVDISAPSFPVVLGTAT